MCFRRFFVLVIGRQIFAIDIGGGKTKTLVKKITIFLF